VWSYFEVDRRVGQDLYRTSFLGRTRFADVFTVTIHTVHETSLEVSRPTGGGLVVEVEGAWPLMDLPLEVRLPWTGRREPLGTVRVDRRGRATLTDPPGGAFDLILAGRPARTPSPVRVEVWAGWDTSSLVRVRRPIVASTLAPLPPAPTLTLTPEPVGVDGAATATVTGAEARASYVLVARWTCANGTPGESDLSAQLDPAGPGVLRAAVELRQVALERFDPACAGPAPAPTLGATLELRRFEARSRRQEVAAMAAVTLSAPR
jgi:hypothetical protein